MAQPEDRQDHGLICRQARPRRHPMARSTSVVGTQCELILAAEVGPQAEVKRSQRCCECWDSGSKA
jgi:hypothetical protein